MHVGKQGGFAASDPQPFHETGDVIEGDVTEHQPPRDHLNKQ